MTTTRCPKCYGTNGHHNTLHERYGNGGGGNIPCPLDPEGTHPMTSNDSTTTPEGAHMQTSAHPGKRPVPPRIPRSIKSIEIERSLYPNTPKPLFVTLKGDMWLMTFSTTDDDLLARINEIAAAMEAVK